jgi:hypothetical protein
MKSRYCGQYSRKMYQMNPCFSSHMIMIACFCHSVVNRGRRFTTNYRMDLAVGFGVFGEERKDIWSTGGEHASVIASRNFDVLIRHLQIVHLLDP